MKLHAFRFSAAVWFIQFAKLVGRLSEFGLPLLGRHNVYMNNFLISTENVYRRTFTDDRSFSFQRDAFSRSDDKPTDSLGTPHGGTRTQVSKFILLLSLK